MRLFRGRAAFFLFMILFVPLLTAAFVFAPPTEEAAACNPCDCPEDDRVNCQGIDEYAVYTRLTPLGNCYIDAYLIDGERFRRVFRASATEIRNVGENPPVNTAIESYFEITLYRLTSGEFQVNYGPSRQDGKIYELRWTGCPATADRTENSFIPGE
ncbi:MAG: hypothetical protein SF162_14960 [bacterium]|nr:hypothetical protein [bacterium]